MNENRLKMNDSTTEFIIFGTRQQKSKITTSCIDVNNIQVSKSRCVKYLGAYLDESLTMKHHITEKCKTASINLFRIKNICKYLTQGACNTVMLGLVIVHIDLKTHCSRAA